VSYDPFARGEAAVGVRTIELSDARREDRRVPVEVWYSPTAIYRGKDRDDGACDRFTIGPGMPGRTGPYVVKPEHAIELTRLITGARLLILPGGHGDYLGEALMPQKDTSYPELTARLIEEFLDSR
jgi:hypothetical protein